MSHEEYAEQHTHENYTKFTPRPLCVLALEFRNAMRHFGLEEVLSDLDNRGASSFNLQWMEKHMKEYQPRLTAADAAIVKGMIARGDLQSDIAAYFRTNSGRISEINTGQTFLDVPPAPISALPPSEPDDRRWHSGEDRKAQGGGASTRSSYA